MGEEDGAEQGGEPVCAMLAWLRLLKSGQGCFATAWAVGAALFV